MTKSLEEEKIVELSSVGQFADGVAVKKIGKNTFDIGRKYIDKMIRVNTDEICAAIKDVFEDTRSILEPAGALSIAGMKKDILNSNHLNRKMVAIACGANMNFERLRFVAERAELGECKEVMMAVQIPECAGSLINFCKLLDNRNLTEFSYRMSNSKYAQIFVGVQVYGLIDKNTRGLKEGSTLILELRPAGQKLKLQLKVQKLESNQKEIVRNDGSDIGPVLNWNPQTGSLQLSQNATQKLLASLGGHVTQRRDTGLTVFFPISDAK